ncbi:MAG: TolC family protein [Bacteroidota bacterium]|nr:TolC family protein [Bacteroidota bacterium]
MRRKTIVDIITATLLLCAVSWAQERTLTLEESIAIGLQNSPALHSSQMKADYAEAKSGETSANLYPSLKVQAAYQRLSSVSNAIALPFSFSGVSPEISFPTPENNYTTKAALQQPLYTGGKLSGAADIAKYSAQASQKDFEKDKADLIYNITSAYWNMYRAQEAKQFADENVDQVSAHLSDIQNRFAQGLATKNDVLKVQVQLSSSKLNQTDAENTLTLAMLSFNSTVGLPLDTHIAIASTLTPTSKEFPQLKELLADASGQRPDMQGMELRVKEAEAGVSVARGGWLPQLFLTGNYYYSRPNQRYFPQQDKFLDSWDVGVSLQFDIWNNLTTVYQTSEAEAQYQQSKDLLRTMKDAVTLDVTQNYLSFEQAKRKIQMTELNVEQANESYRVAKQTFEAGMATNTDLLDAEVALLQAKLLHVQAQVDYELAQARLEKSIGDVSTQ